jgi:hypothetical protein
LEENGLELTGDIANATAITVFAPPSISSLSWNGNSLNFTSEFSGIFTAEISGGAEFTLPEIGDWKYGDGLPEIQSNYSATSSAWISRFPIYIILSPEIR